MKKTIRKGLAALLIIFLFGIVLVSCGPIFDVDGEINGNNGDNDGGQTLPPKKPSSSEYKEVKAYDWLDLADYLQSDDTSYEITLEMETANIYLQRNLSIVMPMKIIGSSGTRYTIHSTNKAGGNASYCLDLQADLELQYCGFIGYRGTSEAGNGIVAGSPPINIRAGKTLTMNGMDSELTLINVGGGTPTLRAGSQVKLMDYASIADSTGDLLFRAGVEKLTISGDASVKNNLTVGSEAVLQIERGGELLVKSGATLTLYDTLKELRLDGNIVVDRTASSEGFLVLKGSLDTLLAKITGGNGSLSVENGITGTTTPFECGANTIVKLSSNGITLGKMISQDTGGLINTSGNITIPKGKKLVVGAGIILDLKDELTLKGGTLEVAGSVNVTTEKGGITLSPEDMLNAIPKGSVNIGSGVININSGHELKDGDLVLTPSLGETSFTIRGPIFTLSGNVDLNVPSNVSDASLTGNYTVAGGAMLTVNGNLSVRFPNTLVGENTPAGSPSTPKLLVKSGVVSIDAKSITGTWEWKQQVGNQWDWSQYP